MVFKLLNTADAAKLLGVSMAFLERNRWAGGGIPFIRVGGRAVRYRLEDLERYIEAQVRHSTSDLGGHHAR